MSRRSLDPALREDHTPREALGGAQAGETVVAIDYRRLCAETKRRPTLLFVAHRSEILTQSMTIYRHAVSDPTFGEKYVDGQHPVSWDHVFASVQSLAQENVAEWLPDKFEVVIVDEFHHAAATNETYARLLTHLAPRELVGLTATPERPDGAPILDWFSGRIAAELRLWDAIDRGLLVPFQYFAVHDVVSIEDVRFLPGGRLDPRELGSLFTGHHARAHLVVEAIRQHVENPLIMRALAFCASVEHARFMADALPGGRPRRGLHHGHDREAGPRSGPRGPARRQGARDSARSTSSTRASTSPSSTPCSSCAPRRAPSSSSSSSAAPAPR